MTPERGGRPKRPLASPPSRMADFVTGDELDEQAGPSVDKRRRHSAGGAGAGGGSSHRSSGKSQGLLTLLTAAIYGATVTSPCPPSASSHVEHSDAAASPVADTPPSDGASDGAAGSPADLVAALPLQPGWTEEEVMILTTETSAGRAVGTLRNYAGALKKFGAWSVQEGYTLASCRSPEDVVAVVARFLRWVADGQPGNDYSGKRPPSYAGLVTCRAAMAMLFKATCLSKGFKGWNPELSTYSDLDTRWKKICGELNPKGQRPAGDPHDIIALKNVSKEEHAALQDMSLKKGTLVGDRQRAINSMDAQSGTRGKEARELRLTDAHPPTELATKPMPSLLFTHTIYASKMAAVGGAAAADRDGQQWQGSGGVWAASVVGRGYMLRNADPLVCGVGSFALFLVHRFEVSGEPIPDLSADGGMEEFKEVMSFPSANCPSVGLGFQDHYEQVSTDMKILNIISAKATHYGRRFCALMCLLAGCIPDEVATLCRWGNSNHAVMQKSYLQGMPTPKVLAVAAGYKLDPATGTVCVWSPRCMMTVGDELRNQVFRNFNHQLQHAKEKFLERGQKVPVVLDNFLVLLRALAVVVVQDALDLAPRYPDHPVYKRLLRLPSFRGLLAEYTSNQRDGKLRRPPTLEESMQLSMTLQTSVARVLATGDGQKELQEGAASIEQDLAMMAAVHQRQAGATRVAASTGGPSAAPSSALLQPAVPPGSLQAQAAAPSSALLQPAVPPGSLQAQAAAVMAAGQSLYGSGGGGNGADPAQFEQLLGSLTRLVNMVNTSVATSAVLSSQAAPAGSMNAALEGVLTAPSEGAFNGGSGGGDDGGGGGSGGGRSGSGGVTSPAPCNLPTQVSNISSVVKVAKLWFVGEGAFPAWKQRESEPLGKGGRVEWRAGLGKAGRATINAVHNIIFLVKLLAVEMDPSFDAEDPRWETVEAAAAKWDATLASLKTGAGPATMGRIKERERMCKLLALDPSKK